jgi:hypothetical protein
LHFRVFSKTCDMDFRFRDHLYYRRITMYFKKEVFTLAP